MFKSSITKISASILAVLISGLAGYLWIVSTWAFSSGERVGYIQKFSNKGWICKTWEGEMVLQGPPGTIAEKFVFSTRDGNVAGKINQTLGKKIALEYEQHKGLPTTCFGDTEYFAAGIKVVE
jgi:hypothetical protein